MKIIKTILFIGLFSLLLSNDKQLNQDIKIDLEPKIDYTPSQRYNTNIPQKIEAKEKTKNSYDVGVDVDVNKEEKTIDKLKLDVEAVFKGID
ncbi:hypothetical protein Q6A73_05030 [Aliarcobacter skirrowii]|uniref:hypothetical protein n=1 Tax=Aliarcobacter skirrowii TaxID=28200 RepID=UPI0021B4A2B7|nr:hypothetical protein [Aliarcobacter skirrowii]MCT7446465.1 hypothetical protein [Aliarcobacter skirrowii]MDX4025966.1 hypothetical protein [Aliarcobacter skirrowii]MDX4057401.1 hypothetical protein [Aliarcobacter skirrowii]MDX4070231.1 hypothetical protein [Aliarcobacter skirrowii]